MTFYGGASGAGWIVPKNYVEKLGDEGFKRAPIGAGPYKFVLFTSGAGCRWRPARRPTHRRADGPVSHAPRSQTPPRFGAGRYPAFALCTGVGVPAPVSPNRRIEISARSCIRASFAFRLRVKQQYSS